MQFLGQMQAMNWRGWAWTMAMQCTGNVLGYRKEMEANQWRAWDEIQQLQATRLTTLLHHAHRHIPYYRQPLDQLALSNLKREPGRVFDEFAQLPCLDKSTIRQQQAHLFTNERTKLRWWYDATGGSTGEPLQFVTDQPHFERRQAVRHLFDGWTGYQVGEPRLMLWGATRDHVPLRQRWRTHWMRRIKQEHWVNTFRLTPDDLEACVTYLQRMHPPHILAYAESLYELARWIEDQQVNVPPPRAMMTSASTLFPHMRALIEKVFAAPVFNRYGSRELGDVACECECHTGLHISPLTHYVEILNGAGKVIHGDEVGEIVVTAFANQTMPLIRYRTGDYGRWATGACDCGRTWPRLASVEGRIQDTLLTPSGAWISSAAINALFAAEKWIGRYQVVQVALNKLEVTLQLAAFPPTLPASAQGISATNSMDSGRIAQGIDYLPLARLTQLESSLRTLLSADCEIQIKIVAEIAPSTSGKHRPVVSHLPIGNLLHTQRSSL